MRHSDNPRHLAVTQSFYEKTKLMILLNYSSNPIDTLAAMCLMICWSANPSDSLSLDGPWHWTGVAVRLALQMGLHKEATYINQPHGSRLRRIWWILLNADRLQSVCFGRPLAVRASDTNTQLPQLSDFAEDNISSKVFVHYATLIEIVGGIANFEIQGRKASHPEREQIYCSLCEWIKNLPDSIRLFDTKGARKQYHASVVELHILFFTAIILLDAHRMRVENKWYMSTPSVIAASCGARLLEEVECHEDIASMSSPVVFYIMVISVPLLYHRVSSEEKEEIRRAEVQILYSTLEQLSARYSSAVLARRYLDKLSDECRKSRAEVQEELETHQVTISEHNASQSSWATGDLFPFPSNLCPNMELVDFDINDQTNGALEFFPVSNDPLHWAFNEPPAFLDFFQIDDMTETLSTAIPFDPASSTFS
ncbi:hypothetical protein B0A52_06409 [Exophiala mesophila]|uniref:Xylanolytic transcriptional activator regulatory domain-containing protein n=1 Tax=Exophiala mesophila TaxID=212818 RepID=A0A438N295_EXOME|nr:hypothetical protein B0A52_06409 [Exophiala mesophila]